MGGRGALSPLGEDIGYFEEGESYAKGEDMNVAPYNPQSGYREVDPEKTLAHIETMMDDLDHEQMFIMDDDGYIVSATDGEKGAVAYTLKALQASRGNVVTHNHPRKGRGESGLDGGTFSVADINTLELGMKELRAVGNEGTYSMKATRNADPVGLYKALQRDKPTIVRQQKEVAGRVEKSYEQGRFKTKHEAKATSFNQQLGVVHRWFERNSERYGYHYSFTPASERKTETVTPPKRRTQKEIDRDNRGIYYGRHKAEEQKKAGAATVDRESLLIGMGFEKQADGTLRHPKTGQVVELFQKKR